jgi:hypothetical protein
MQMPSIASLRHLALAAALVLPTSLAAQTEVRVMPFAGAFPFLAGQAGVHVQLLPGGSDWSVFAEYETWVWGHCLPPLEGEVDPCAGVGNGFHAGVTKYLMDRSASWRPFIGVGAGYAEPVGDDDPGLSVLGEGGVDIGGARWLSVRLGVRVQGRPGVATDFGGAMLGLRLRL